MLTLGSLFAGIGGFDLGFERAGFKTVWQCEIDKSAQSVLRRWFPDAALHSDVCQVGAHNLAPVDVVTFGSPCQDLSVAGKRAGLAGGRSGLFHEAARIVRELRERYGKPDFAIWENVPGAFSSNGGADFAAVVQTMVDLGARDVCWRVLDSRYFGVAQRRRRVFLVADFGGERAEQVLFEPESLRGDSAKGGKKRKEAARGAGAGVAGGGREWPAQVAATLDCTFGTKWGQDNQHVNQGCPNFVPTVDRTVSDTVTAKWAKGTGGYAGVSEHSNLTIFEAPAIGVFRQSYTAGTLTAQSGGLGETRNPAFVVEQAVVPFDTTQPTSPSNYSSPKPGNPCHPLAAGAHPPATYVAQAMAFSPLQGGRSMPVTAESPTLEAGTGNKAPAVLQPIAFHPTQDPISSQDGISHAMSSGNRQGCGTVAVCATGERTHALTTRSAAEEDGTGRGTPITVQPPMQVRRLTPTECERLQGFPDGWTSEATLPDGKVKPQADGPRYKQLGNAVTVNVAEWIARRLVAAVGVE